MLRFGVLHYVVGKRRSQEPYRRDAIFCTFVASLLPFGQGFQQDFVSSNVHTFPLVYNLLYEW